MHPINITRLNYQCFSFNLCSFWSAQDHRNRQRHWIRKGGVQGIPANEWYHSEHFCSLSPKTKNCPDSQEGSQQSQGRVHGCQASQTCQGSVCFKNHTTEHHQFIAGRAVVEENPKDKAGPLETKYHSRSNKCRQRSTRRK